MTADGRQSWRDIRDQIHGRIIDSTYRPGEKLPRDEDIAQELKCARSTVHRAMRSLAEDGLIERRRKGGTTVNPDPVTRTTIDIPITRIDIESRGYAYHHHLIDTMEIEAPHRIAAKFGNPSSGPMLRIRALHLADAQPYIFEDRWISLRSVSEISDVDFQTVSANEWLVRNRPFSRCDVQILADDIFDDEAAYLEEPVATALLVLERTTWAGDAPITHVRAVHKRGYRLVSNSTVHDAT
ncbi:MAG: GntR family transcriptional regulator [Litoreibacter sp.]|nr:GntR family transcriptional regulator [Litoreibacter sp.]